MHQLHQTTTTNSDSHSRLASSAAEEVNDSDPKTLMFGNVKLDWSTHRVHVGKRLVELSPIDIRLLKFLMEAPHRAFTRKELLRAVWPEGVFVGQRTVDAHVKTLRKALRTAGAPNLIRTIRSRGYALDRTR